MRIIPGEIKTGQLHAYLLGAVAPRPICFASTVDSEGRPNLAPFSFFNVFGSNPPILVFSPARRVRDNTVKHTLDNIYATKEVVVNVVNYDMVQQTSLASVEYPKGVNEFIKSGFTPIASELVRPPRVAESPVQLECVVNEVKPLGDGPGAGNLVIAEIKLMHIDEKILDAEGRIDQLKLEHVARLGGDWYCHVSKDNLFKVAKPVRTMGIGVDAIPYAIRHSKILTGNNLGQLGNVEALPTDEAIDEYCQSPGINEILDATIGDSQTRETQLHLKAKQLLDENRVDEAWKVLLVG